MGTGLHARRFAGVLVAVLVLLTRHAGLAACNDPAAFATARATTEQACAGMGTGCATATSHAAYVSCVAAQAKAAVKAGTLPKKCKNAVVKCAAKSTCGKSGFVACCRTTKKGKTACGIKPSAKCTTPKGGPCPGSPLSCCDSCGASGCVACPTCGAHATCVGTVCVCDSGYSGDGQTCNPVAVSLAGLRWELPCTGTGDVPESCATTSRKVTSAVLGGLAGAQYDTALRFRGVVEQTSYTGGTADGFWYTGGSPSDPKYNVYRLDVSNPPQTYFLNAGTAQLLYCVAIDYTRSLRIATGATVTLTADPLDGLEIKNRDSNGMPIVIPGIPPAPAAFDGQFIQMDVLSVSQAP
jgi:hypothetical protein